MTILVAPSFPPPAEHRGTSTALSKPLPANLYAATTKDSQTHQSFLSRTVNDPIAVFSFALVVSTVLLVVSTVLLWRATLKLAREARKSSTEQSEKMERSITEAGNATRAMQEQNRIAENTAKQELRAYLCLRAVTMNTITAESEKYVITMPLDNAGHTPANRVIIQWAWQVMQGEPDDDFFEATLQQYPVGEQRETCIGPHQFKEIPSSLLIGAEFRARIINEGWRFYLLGRIHYEDAFAEQRITEFFYRYTEELPNRLGQMLTHNRIT